MHCRPRSAEVERVEAILGPYGTQLTDGKRVAGPETPPPAPPTATEQQLRPYYQDASVTLFNGDVIAVLGTLPDESVHCCVTSPPYWGLRDYGHSDQIGLEKTPDEYVAKMVKVFRGVRRVLRDDGTLWLNLGDTYNAYNGGSGPSSKIDHPLNERNGQKPVVASGFGLRFKGLKPKDLVGIPWRVAFALQADGWYLRSDIIWHKPNPMPESVTDRPTKAHEYLFLLSKSERYHYDASAIKEPAAYPDGPNAPDKIASPHGQGFTRRADKQRGHSRRHAGFNDRWDSMSKEEQGALGRNKRSVWTVATRPYVGAHFATFPPDLIIPCILAGCPEGGTVLDPFGGSGTTGYVAKEHGRKAVLIELNRDYCALAVKRWPQEVLDLEGAV